MGGDKGRLRYLRIRNLAVFAKVHYRLGEGLWVYRRDEIEAAYAELDIPFGASLAQVKDQQRFLATRFHPDALPTNSPYKDRAEDKLKRVNAAVDLLAKYLADAGTTRSPSQTTQSGSRGNTQANHSGGKEESRAKHEKERQRAKEYETKLAELLNRRDQEERDAIDLVFRYYEEAINAANEATDMFQRETVKKKDAITAQAKAAEYRTIQAAHDELYVKALDARYQSKSDPHRDRFIVTSIVEAVSATRDRLKEIKKTSDRTLAIQTEKLDSERTTELRSLLENRAQLLIRRTAEVETAKRAIHDKRSVRKATLDREYGHG
ncbi:MAG: hypothetical protein AB2L09_03605 [Coriobacteriia bacterium]